MFFLIITNFKMDFLFAMFKPYFCPPVYVKSAISSASVCYMSVQVSARGGGVFPLPPPPERGGMSSRIPRTECG